MGFKGQKKVFQKGQNKGQRGPGPKYSCHPVQEPLTFQTSKTRNIHRSCMNQVNQ